MGLADVALLETGLVEIGVVVGDEAQGRGLGRLLAEAVASLAIQRGRYAPEGRDARGQRGDVASDGATGPTVRSVEEGTLVAYTRLEAARRRNAA